MPHSTDSRGTPLLAVLVFLVSLGWFYGISQGKVHYEPDGATALHVALNIATGNGLAVNIVFPGETDPQPRPTITKPPLFTSVLSVAIQFGLSPREAGLLVVAMSGSVALTILFLMARSVLPPLPALLVAGLFLIQVPTVRWGISAHEEILFVALSLVTLRQLVTIANRNDRQPMFPYFLLGVLAALAMLASYQGLPLLLLTGVYVLYLALRDKRITRVLAFGGGITITAAWPLIRFIWLWSQGNRPGFDTAQESAYYKMLAGIAASMQNDFLGRQIVWLYDASTSDVILVTCLYLGLALLLAFAWRNRNLRPLALYAALYVAVLVLQLGGQGKDVYEPRYSVPVYGLLFLFLVYAAHRAVSRWQGLRKAGLVVGLLAVSVYAYGQIGRYAQLLGGDSELCPAPETYAWLNANVPSQSVVAATQCGYRMLVESSEHYWMPIPPARDVTNDDRWQEEDLLQVCRSSSNAWILLIDGAEVDPFREKPGYGPLIDQLFDGRASGSTELAAKLDDGLIYRIKCPGGAGE